MKISKAQVALSGLPFILLGAFIISFSPVLARFTELPPTAITFYRMAFGSSFLTIYALFKRQSLLPAPSTRASMLPLLVAGAVVFMFDLDCWHRSIFLVGPGLATILANFQVFILGAVSVLFFAERYSHRIVIAPLLALVGLYLLVGVDMDHLPDTAVMGIVYGLLTAVWYSCYILILRKSQTLPGRMPPESNLALLGWMVTLIAFATAMTTGTSLALPTSTDWICMVLYGLGPQALGWVLLSRGLPHVPPSIAGLAMLLQPTLAFIWDIVIFSRPTGASGWMGAILALIAIYIGFKRKKATS